MDSKELMMTMMIKMENNNTTTCDPLLFSSLQQGVTGFDDSCSSSYKQGVSGFMDLLGFQDFSSYYSPVFDINQLMMSQPPMEMVVATSSAHDDDDEEDNLKKKKEEEDVNDEEETTSTSVVLNGQQPSSPNSCSISSSHQQPLLLHKPSVKQGMKGKKALDDGDERKPKAKKKKEREARFAFMTRSEIDHLDDGYRWRKYGQKAVKNSHFPRSYYRCTSASCNVKKRVERCMGDPSYVVTTYEGQHIHPASVGTHTSNAYSFDHLINPAITTNATNYANTPHAMMKLEQGAGLLQDMLHFPQ
uniref:WRKY transcription factor 23 n=1 Tax=Erigeron canadensis TaxID=72917 RepID=UPI001CB8B5BB|nr:WRKY transcription factor 23 [Erigeron canadensis]